MNSSITATTESLSEEEQLDDDEDLSDEDFDELAAEVESLDASHIRLASSSSAPNLQKTDSTSSLTSSLASSSRASRIRHQIAHLNLERGATPSTKTPDTPTPHALGDPQQHPASTPANQTYFSDSGQTPTPGPDQAGHDTSSLRGRSQSESVLMSNDPTTSVALQSRIDQASTPAADHEIAPKRPGMGARTRSGSLLKTAMAAAAASSSSPSAAAPFSSAPDVQHMPEITLAVVGDKNVGKSTVIQSVIKKQSGASPSGTMLFQQGSNASKLRTCALRCWLTRQGAADGFLYYQSSPMTPLSL